MAISTPSFSKKLNLAQRKYSAFDRELLAIYKVIKHFCLEIEGRHLHVLTDHKPLVSAIQNSPANPPPRCFQYFDFISQFTSDVSCIKDVANIVCDFLSRVDAVSSLIDLSNLAILQSVDDKLMQLVSNHSSSLHPICTYFSGVTWRNVV